MIGIKETDNGRLGISHTPASITSFEARFSENPISVYGIRQAARAASAHSLRWISEKVRGHLFFLGLDFNLRGAQLRIVLPYTTSSERKSQIDRSIKVHSDLEIDPSLVEDTIENLAYQMSLVRLGERGKRNKVAYVA